MPALHQRKPQTSSKTCARVFTHFDDDDPEALEAGLVNLDAWLADGDNLAQTVEGYQITNLDSAAIQGIDTSTDKVSGLVGAAVAKEHRGTARHGGGHRHRRLGRGRPQEL